MAKGPKGFSEDEKKALRTKLCSACEQSWSIHGYKKTSITDLTTITGIATGSFYLLFTSKEELFCETMLRIQQRLIASIEEIMKHSTGKEGFEEVVSWHFQEYSKHPFLYDTTTPDFLAFYNRLPESETKKLQYDSRKFYHEVLTKLHLTLKVEEETAYAIINTLLYTAIFKDRLGADSFQVFRFILHSVSEHLFE